MKTKKIFSLTLALIMLASIFLSGCGQNNNDGDIWGRADAKESENIKLGHSTEITLTINAANNIIANSSITSFEEDNRSFSVSVAKQLMESYGLKPQEAMDAAYPVHIGTRILHNPTAGYTNFMLPDIVMNGLQIR